MGNEICCSNQRDQNELKFRKPERNILLNRRGSDYKYGITPGINYEIDKISENRDELEIIEHAKSNNKVITNDEFVYGRIETMKNPKEIKLKNSYKNNYFYESEKLRNEIIEDEDGPKDGVKKKSLKTNYKTNFDNKNITTNSEVKSIEINTNNNFLDNFNIPNNNNINDSITQLKIVHQSDNANDFNSNDNKYLKIKSEVNLDYFKSNNVDNFPKYNFPEPQTEKNQENFISNNSNLNNSIERINNIDFTFLNKNINKINDNNVNNVNNDNISNSINNNINNKITNNNIDNYNLSNNEEIKKNTTIDIGNINNYINDNNSILKKYTNNINESNDFIDDKNNNLNNSIKPKVFIKPIVAQSNNNNTSFYQKKKVEKEFTKYTINNSNKINSNDVNTKIITSKIKEYENENNNKNVDIIKEYGNENNNKNVDIIKDNNAILPKENKIQNSAIVKKLEPIQYQNNNNVIRAKPLPIIENNDDIYNNNISIKNDIIYNSNIPSNNEKIPNNLYINNPINNIKEDIDDRKNTTNNVLRKDIYKNTITNKINTLENKTVNKIQANEKKNIFPAMSFSPKEIDDIFVEGERKYNIMNRNQNIVENNFQNHKIISKKEILESNKNENYTYNYNNSIIKTPNYKNQSKTEKHYNQTIIPEQKMTNEVKNNYSKITKIEKIIPSKITKIEKSITKDPLITSDVNFNKRVQAFTPEKKIKTQSTPYIYPLTPDQKIITHSKPDINLSLINHSKSLINYNINDEIDSNINYNINDTINKYNTNNQYVQIIPNDNKINKNISKIETIQYSQNQIYTSNPVIEKQDVNYNSPSKNVKEPTVNYHSPLKNVKTYVEYNSPSKSRNDPTFDYNSLTEQTRHVIINSPVKINKPIYQYNQSEETAPITYSPTKVLPPIITYTNSETFNNISQYYPKVKNKQSKQITNINNYTNIPNVISPKKAYEINQALTMDNQQRNYKVDNKMVPTYFTTDNINNYPVVQKDPNESILNHTHLNKIQNLNLNNPLNYQINSLRSKSSGSSNYSNLSSKDRQFDAKGNPIYQVSLNQGERKKNRKNRFSKDLRSSLSSNSNNNYSPIYYNRSLSQEDFNGPISNQSKNNQFSDYNSRGSSPDSVISDNPQSIDKNMYNIINTNNNINNFPIYQQVQSPSNISLIRPTIETIDNNKRAINYYSKLDCTKFVTFSPESYQLFYPKNEPYFIIPKNEIYAEQDMTIPINNNPNLKETFIGSINKLGYRHGFGKLTTPNSKKIGTWRNGKFSGWGREIGKNGQVFEGKFSDGKLNGKGIYKSEGQVLYVGDFQNHLRQGKGEKITKNYHYIGHFNKNKIDGYGKIQFFKSKEGIAEYEGDFKNNNIEGKGRMKWINGNMYEGEVKDGKMNGYGKFYPNNGVPIEGFFIDGVRVNNIDYNQKKIF